MKKKGRSHASWDQLGMTCPKKRKGNHRGDAFQKRECLLELVAFLSDLNEGNLKSWRWVSGGLAGKRRKWEKKRPPG